MEKVRVEKREREKNIEKEKGNMQNKKYFIIIAVLAALLMGAIGVIVGITMQQKMNASSDEIQIVQSEDAMAKEGQVNEVKNDEANNDGTEAEGQEESTEESGGNQNDADVDGQETETEVKGMIGNTPVERYGALQVKGNRLTDQNGNQVQLKGISTHGLSWYPQYVNCLLYTSPSPRDTR